MSGRIAVFDKNGKPLMPPEGITFDGNLGLMQGIIVVPGTGDVWAARDTGHALARICPVAGHRRWITAGLAYAGGLDHRRQVA